MPADFNTDRMRVPRYRRHGADRFRARRPKCGLCRRKLDGPYKSVAGHPRCYWCLKRVGNV